MNKKIIIGGAIGIAALAAMIFLARPDSQPTVIPANLTGATSTLAVMNDSAYDFGPISMADGVVSYAFKVKNEGTKPIMIQKIYTSCMCTTAELSLTGKSYGPYGMPGHGSIPTINEEIVPGEDVSIEVVFDPAAHGPAGVGKIVRAVLIENNGGAPVELRVSATVTP